MSPMMKQQTQPQDSEDESDDSVDNSQDTSDDESEDGQDGSTDDSGDDDSADGSQQQSGPQPVENIGFNQDVQNILWSRVQTLTPEEIKVMDTIVTPTTYPVLAKLFPELVPLLQKGTALQQATASTQQTQPEQQQQNPLVNPDVSRGLTGY